MALILGLDTTTNLCACALLRGGDVLARLSADIGKGHGEYLMGQIDGVLKKAGVRIDDIARIGVGCGPGSFTGIRVGVAAARGLALALDVPAIGVSRFAAIHHLKCQLGHPVMVVLQGFGESMYAQHFDGIGRLVATPFQGKLEEMVASLPRESVLSGTGAAIVAKAVQAQRGFAPPVVEVDPFDEVCAIAAITAKTLPDAVSPPVPLYLRPPDAKPQMNFANPRQTHPPKFNPKSCIANN